MPSLQSANLVPEILQLRSQGLTDSLIAQELQDRGYMQAQIEQALMQADSANGTSYPASPASPAYSQPSYAQPRMSAPPTAEEGNIYERIEEIAESMIDEKWDLLIAEEKKRME